MNSMELFHLTVYSEGKEIDSTYIVCPVIKNNGITLEAIKANGDGPLTARKHYYNPKHKVIYSNCTFVLKTSGQFATEESS